MKKNVWQMIENSVRIFNISFFEYIVMMDKNFFVDNMVSIKIYVKKI